MTIVFAVAAASLAYLLLAAVSLWAVSRYLRPLRMRTSAALALLPLVFTGPAMLTGEVKAPLDHHYTAVPLKALEHDFGIDSRDRTMGRYDVAVQIIPWRAAVRHALAHGEWPVYNPFMLCGDILEASAQPAAYHPIHLISYLLPFGIDLTFAVAAALFAAGLGGYCFCRDIVSRDLSALIGATGWMFCDFILGWLGWPMALTVVFFPLLLLGVRRVVRQPGWCSGGLLTVAFTLILLGGHPETAFHCVAVAAMWGVAELVATRGRAFWPAVGISVAAGVVALALCAIDLLPFTDAMPQTRQYRFRSEIVGDPSAPWPVALERMRAALVPYAYGVPWSEWIRTKQFTPIRSGYAGSVLFAPALFALWRSRWRGRWLLLGMFVAGVLLWVSAPGLIDLLGHVPLFDVAINRRLVFVSGLAASVLAALGADSWAARTHDRGFALLGAGILALHGAAIALMWSGFEAAGLSTSFLTERTLVELVPMLLVVILMLGTRSVRVGLLGLMLILVGQRVLQMGPLDPSFPSSMLRPEIEELAALEETGEPYRVTGYDLALRPNLCTLYGLEDVRGYQAMTNWHLFSTYDLWTSTRPPYQHAAIVMDLSRPFLSFLNVRYAFAPVRVPPPEHWQVVARGRGFNVLENLHCLPRAFVPATVRVNLPLRRVRSQMAAARDFARVAWIQRIGDGRRGKPEVRVNGPGLVATRREGLGLHLDVDLLNDGWVVVSQTAWKGWRATTATGQALQLHLANRAFLAFQLPAGHHEVELRYLPQSFVVGRAVTFTTLGLLVLAGLLSCWRRRRPAAASPPPETSRRE